MLGSSELMDALRGIGLNLYERKLWVGLLTRGTATAGELSSLANVPRSRTYDVLETLSKKGFVIIQPSKPLKYVAISPEDAFEKAKDREREKIILMEQKIDKIKTSKMMEELKTIYEQGMETILPEDLTGALKGSYSVIQQMDSMLKNASSSVNIVTTPAGIDQLFESHLVTLKKLKKNGVKIKIASNLKKSPEQAIKALSAIAEMRNITEDTIPFSGKFCVVDGQQLMMGLSDPEVRSTQEMMFWSKSQYTAKNMIEPLFNMVWEKSSPFTKKAN